MTTRVMTITEYLLETLNRQARERGEDIEIVFNNASRARPQFATKNGENIVPLNATNQAERTNDNG